MALVLAMAVACGVDGGETGATGSGAAPSNPPASQSAAPAVDTAAAPEDPCEWIPAADVAAIVGPLTGTPIRVRSAEGPRPDPHGRACQYALAQAPKMGEGTVTVEVVLNADAIFENVVGSMRDKFAREFGDGGAAAPGTAPASPASAGGWDYAGRMPNTFIGRQGHIGVTVSTQTFDVAYDTLAALARVVRDRMPDQPFAEPPLDPVLAEIAAMDKKAGIEPRPEPLPPDACALLTRAEAEAVLGPLMTAPYRSAKNTPFASATGASCTYYSANHRALVLSPEWSNGKMLFNMVKGVSGMVGAATGASAPGTAGTGPWDQVAGDVTGVLHFLKGDRVLEVQYHTSSTDREGALKLAAVAVNRL